MPTQLHGSVRARDIHQTYPAIDLHADSLLWSRWLGYDLNKRHMPPLPRAWLGGHVDVPRLQEGGIGVQCLGLVSVPGLDLSPLKACHRQIDLLETAIAQSQGQLRMASKSEALQKTDGGITTHLGIEGAHALEGRIDNLDRFAERGVRYLGLVHFHANTFATPAVGWRANRDRGLTALGRDLVVHAESHNVLVDLSHLNAKGFADALAIAKKPLIVSHTGAAGVCDMWRNTSDDQLRGVAQTGGVVGVIFCPRYLGRDGVDAVADHIMHIIKVAGEDTPALGSDWDGFIRPTQGLEEASKLPNLTDVLLSKGLTPTVIGKILRTNALRVLQKTV